MKDKKAKTDLELAAKAEKMLRRYDAIEGAAIRRAMHKTNNKRAAILAALSPEVRTIVLAQLGADPLVRDVDALGVNGSSDPLHDPDV